MKKYSGDGMEEQFGGNSGKAGFHKNRGSNSNSNRQVQFAEAKDNQGKLMHAKTLPRTKRGDFSSNDDDDES